MWCPYGVDDQGFLDYDRMRELALECKPKMIIAGASAYARTIDFKKFREVCDEVGAVLMVDMAHIAGLVAAGLHPSPIPYADVVTTTTHKTLRGPRGGMILCNKEAAAKYNFNKAVFPGIQGGPLMHVIAGKAVCFKEALSEEFKVYQKNIVDNAQALCKGLMDQGREDCFRRHGQSFDACRPDQFRTDRKSGGKAAGCSPYHCQQEYHS